MNNFKLIFYSLIFSSSVAVAQINSELIAYYPLNGNAGDSSGNGNHGTVTGAIPANDRYGQPNKAYRFINNNDQITSILATNVDLSTEDGLSVSAWVLLDSINYYDARIANLNNDIHVANGVKNFELLVNGNIHSPHQAKVTWLNYSGAAQNPVHLSTIDTVSVAQWIHLTATWDRLSNTEKVYINGTLSAQQNNVASPFILKNITLGRHPDAAWCLRGVLDEVRVYKRSLSQTDITELYNQGISTSIEDQQTNTLHATIYPNPSNGFVNIYLPDANPTLFEISIYDLLGKEIIRRPFVNCIDLTTMNPGIYVLKLVNTTSQASLTQKIIKE